jgi:hypothetical protein
VLDVLAKFSPEGAGQLGVDGLDEEISDLGPGIEERTRKISVELLGELNSRLEDEKNSKVRQDLGILIKTVEDSIRSSDLNYEQMLPYFNVNQTVFFGVRGIIDPQNSRDRYPAAIARLEKYAGITDGHIPFTQLAMDRTEERFDVEGLVGPYRGEVEQDLERAETMITGIEELLAGTDLQGWEESYTTLAGQMRDYNDWVRAEILPRSREDYRLPLDLYEDALRNWGVDAAPDDLIEQATKGYMDIRGEMQALAPLVAAAQGYDTNDYREVIALLKRDGAIDGDKLLDHYNAVLRDIEEIIVREQLISLPERDAGIRIATAAETAAQPAPHHQPPRLIGKTGE